MPLPEGQPSTPHIDFQNSILSTIFFDMSILGLPSDKDILEGFGRPSKIAKIKKQITYFKIFSFFYPWTPKASIRGGIAKENLRSFDSSLFLMYKVNKTK